MRQSQNTLIEVRVLGGYSPTFYVALASTAGRITLTLERAHARRVTMRTGQRMRERVQRALAPYGMHAVYVVGV
ncbi:MAG TPA: hypothetical protein VGE36_14275 [Roseateles sp.]